MCFKSNTIIGIFQPADAILNREAYHDLTNAVIGKRMLQRIHEQRDQDQAAGVCLGETELNGHNIERKIDFAGCIGKLADRFWSKAMDEIMHIDRIRIVFRMC